MLEVKRRKLANTCGIIHQSKTRSANNLSIKFSDFRILVNSLLTLITPPTCRQRCFWAQFSKVTDPHVYRVAQTEIPHQKKNATCRQLNEICYAQLNFRILCGRHTASILKLFACVRHFPFLHYPVLYFRHLPPKWRPSPHSHKATSPSPFPLPPPSVPSPF